MIKLSLLLTIMLLVLPACSSVEQRTPVRSPEAEAAVLLVEAAEGRTDAAARADLLTALGIFEGFDDRPGRWSASKALADWHMAHRQNEPAVAYSRQALALAPSMHSSSAMYASALQLGQLTQDRVLILSAMPHAQSGLEKAVLHVLLEEYEVAKQAMAAHEPSAGASRTDMASLAFVLYQIGKHNHDRNLVSDALNNYRLAADVRGVTDSLFLLAMLTESPDEAREYAQRALLAARQSGEDSRVSAITHWLDSEGSPQ